MSITNLQPVQISPKGLQIIKDFEGLRLKAYRDQVGIPTIGWGTTQYENGVKVKMGDIITLARAQKLLEFEAAAKAFVIAQALRPLKITLTQNQIDSLVSLAYNIGVHGLLTSTVFRLVKANPKDPAIRNAFMMWIKGTKNGKKIVIPALVARRKKEADLYFS